MSPSTSTQNDLKTLSHLFRQHATPVTSAASDGDLPLENYSMSRDQFVQALAEHDQDVQFHGDRALLLAQYGVLFDLVDEKRTGRISFTEFALFHDLTRKPKAEYEIVFRLFDRDGDGKLSASQFMQALQSRVPADNKLLSDQFEQSEVFRLYFSGKREGKTNAKERELTLGEFSQLLKGLQEERLRLEFSAYDSEHSGFVNAEDFVHIVKTVAKHKLTPFVEENLHTFGNLYMTGGSKVSWAVTMAFHNILCQMDLIRYLVKKAGQLSPDGTVTKSKFVQATHEQTRSAVFTPIEVDVLFHLARLFAQQENAASKTAGKDATKTTLTHFEQVLAPSTEVVSAVHPTTESMVVEHEPSWVTALRSVYNFTLGSVAGALGATVVYPIDLVKTRMQNQRSAVVGELMYKNSMDCFRKVIRNEGVVGLYSGLGPQLVGVAPEKAIKLTMNDLVRSILKDEQSGELPLWAEVTAGFVAGGSQVLFTNPLEIVKIRLQVQGQTAGVSRKSAIQIVKELGVMGLYKGTSACLLRDIPFSGIYFTSYAHLKKDFFGESETKRLSMLELLAAGAMAGMPAAYLTTPADVIKTRLQVEAKKGESTYTGITDAFRKILKEEGPRAFFKGGPARIFRSSPQFGVTLMSYELFKQWVPFPWSQKTGHQQQADQQQASTGLFRLRHVMRLMHDIDYKFGVIRPFPGGPLATAKSGN